MLTHFCLKFFEDWHQIDLKKSDLKKKKRFQNTKKKSSYFHLFIYSFIYLFTFFCRGGRWGAGGGSWVEGG